MVAGTELKITPDGVFITTPGIFKVKAGTHILEEGNKVDFKLPLIPESKNTSVQFHFTDDDKIPYAFVNYTAIYENGRNVEGTTDENGFTEVFYSTTEQEIEVHLDI